MNSDGTSATESASERPKPSRYKRKLSHPVVALRLMRELALTDKSERLLSEEYGCAPSAIHQFKERRLDQIMDIRANSEDEFAGILFVKKAERLQAYAEMMDDPAMTKADAQRALRQIAEELGALPNRLNVQAEQTIKVEHVVRGVDPDALK